MFKVNDQGVFVKPNGVNGEVLRPNPQFQPQPIKVDRFQRFDRLCAVFPQTVISALDFSRATMMLEDIQHINLDLYKLHFGLCLPIVLPKLNSDIDYGREAERLLVLAGNAYLKTFPDRQFNNYRAGKLDGQVVVDESSRHQVVLDRMQNGPLVATYFPHALLGWSPPAAREFVQTLPKGFTLAGVLDTAVAMVGYVDVLAKSCQSPALDCSGVKLVDPGRTIYFVPDDDELNFMRGRESPDENYSSGLLYVG